MCVFCSTESSLNSKAFTKSYKSVHNCAGKKITTHVAQFSMSQYLRRGDMFKSIRPFCSFNWSSNVSPFLPRPLYLLTTTPTLFLSLPYYFIMIPCLPNGELQWTEECERQLVRGLSMDCSADLTAGIREKPQNASLMSNTVWEVDGPTDSVCPD